MRRPRPVGEVMTSCPGCGAPYETPCAYCGARRTAPRRIQQGEPWTAKQALQQAFPADYYSQMMQQQPPPMTAQQAYALMQAQTMEARAGLGGLGSAFGLLFGGLK